ncbi:hypothetical protein IFM89_011136 [Coptis chinensis]|uniref:Uncharacterized protein n=1 Tax=Coptis chinensis TaxID=261450 RepID=A0A835LQ05_9MAGN|nr:hypothetical protein IFM89_011136 [Coptis chinensis]
MNEKVSIRNLSIRRKKFVRGTCNGLVLLEDICATGNLSIANPVTGQLLKLPPCTQRSKKLDIVRGTTYFDCSEEYKIISIVIHKTGWFGCEMLAVGSSAWKWVASPFECVGLAVGTKCIVVCLCVPAMCIYDRLGRIAVEIEVLYFIKILQIQTVAKTAGMHRNEWVENADRWIVGFLGMFEEGCHKMGTAIRDRIQERLKGQNSGGLLQDGDEMDYEEYYDEDEEYYDEDEEYYDDEEEK